MTDAGAGAAPPAGRLDALAARTPAIILAYYALQAALRISVPGALGLDEAQIVVHAQSAEWGYGPQPPLYAWLQIAVFSLVGETLVGLALLKNAALAAAALGVWAAARGAGAGPRVACVAALSLLLLPGFAWEAQRALTHTALATGMVGLALPVFVALRRSADPGLALHLALGALVGLGVLAKWNVALPGAALFAVLLLWPRAPRLRALAGLAASIAVVAPTGLWALRNAEAATAHVGKLGLAPDPGLATLLAGLGAVGTAAFATFALLALTHGALFPRPAPTAQPGPDPALRADLTRVLAFALGLVVAATLLSGATEMKERWLTPLAVIAPLVGALWLAPRITARRASVLAGLVGLLALTVAAALQVNWRTGIGGSVPYQSAPFATLAPRVAAGGGSVLAASDWIGGNLRLAAPRLAVVTPLTPTLDLEMPPPRQLVWRATEDGLPPAPLRDLYTDRFGAPPRLGPVERLTAPRAAPHGDTPFVLMRAEAR